jgi:hypothetical protein
MSPPTDHLRGYVDARVRDIENAAQRSRWVYIALITVSWLIISVSYSSSLSWTRSMAEGIEADWNRNQANAIAAEPDCSEPASTKCRQAILSRYGFDARDPVDWMRAQSLSAWTNSLFFEVPIIGARVSSSDAGVVGGVALLLLGIWGFFSARRENHLVYYLIRDAVDWDWDPATRYYVRLQVSATQIFTSGWHDEPLSAPALRVVPNHKRRADWFMRRLLWVMFMLPVVALMFVLGNDIYSLLLDSPLRPGSKILWEVLVYEKCGGHAGLQCEAFRSLIWRLGLSAMFMGLQFFVGLKWYRFQSATSDLLEATRDWKSPQKRDKAGLPPSPVPAVATLP